MSSISSPHSFSQRFGILSFDCEGNERYYSNLNLHVLVVNLKFGIDVFSTKDCQLRLIIIQFCRSIQVRVPILYPLLVSGRIVPLLIGAFVHVLKA